MTAVQTREPNDQADHAQRCAQHDAQPCAQHQTMPIAPYHRDTATIAQVMDRAGISQASAAKALNIESGHMSRIMGDSSPVPFALVRWLWAKTGDRELLTLITEASPHLRVEVFAGESVPQGIDLQTAVSSAMGLLSQASASGTSRDAAAAALLRLQSVIRGAIDTLAGQGLIATAATANGYGARQPTESTVNLRA